MDVRRARATVQGILDHAELFPDLGMLDDAGLAEVVTGILSAGDYFESACGFLEGLLALREDLPIGADRSFSTLAPIVIRKMGCGL